MKILYFGGQKSGKSKVAEKKILTLSRDKKPYYIATYNNNYKDKEMQERINRHKLQRKNSFITIEESFNLSRVIQNNNSYLVDCISMWIFNMLEQKIDKLITEIELLSKIDANIVFVLNDVNSGIIPIDRDSRRFIDYTGIIGQKIVSICNEVYEVKFGIPTRLK
jgi:adenosylcobinamide kinase/adenosylcobinamide-phosphate guanylyltransferase